MRPGDEKGQRLLTEDGEMVEGVKSIEWHADAVNRPIVTVQLFPEKLHFDITTHADEPSL
jgi:hypothetical protein